MVGSAKADPSAVKVIAAIAKKNQRAAETLSLRALRKADASLAAKPWEQVLASRAEVVLDNVETQLRRGASAPAGKELPAPSLGQSAYIPLLTPAPLGVRYGPRAKLAWTSVRWLRTEGHRNVAQNEGIESGEPVSFQLDGAWWYGAYVGSDLKGHPVVLVRSGSESWTQSTSWKQLRVLRPLPAATPGAKAPLKPAAPFRAPIANESPKPVSEPLRALLVRALLIPVFQNHVGREYVEQLALAGHHVFLTGGVVRDLIAALKAKPDIPAAEATRLLTPLDIVTSASTDHIRANVHAIEPTDPNGGVWWSLLDEQQGKLNVGGKAAGSINSRGMSITPLRSFGYRDQPRVTDKGERYFPVVFGHSIEEDSAARDFTMNAIYVRYDEKNELTITDPFGGQAVQDAEARLLRRIPEASLDSPSLLLRFWNFRRRGFNAEPTTLKEILSASQVLNNQPPPRIAEILARLFFNECKTPEQVPALIQQLGDAMRAGGAGEAFASAVGTDKVRQITTRRIADGFAQK